MNIPQVYNNIRTACAPFFGWLARSHVLPVILLLIIGGYTHGMNMFNYPYYESDEGTYTSQAWSLVRDGELSPYTYWYDHPPAGWIQIATWFVLLGGDVFFFGTSTDTARVLMWLFYMATLVVLYTIAYFVSRSRVAAFAACLAFALSPLGIYFRRRVLLDNIMTFWILASFLPLMVKEAKLRHFALSGLLYGTAFLTKITAAVWGPAILYMVLQRKYLANAVFRAGTWLLFSIGLTSVYLIYAFTKSEFFPSGWFGTGEHVSLLSSLQFQMGRGSALPFYDPGSDFLGVFRDWANKDMFALVVLFAAIAMGVALWRTNERVRPFVLASLLYIVFLARGGIVLNFYVLPLIATATILLAAGLAALSTYLTLGVADLKRRGVQVYRYGMHMGTNLWKRYSVQILPTGMSQGIVRIIPMGLRMRVNNVARALPPICVPRYSVPKTLVSIVFMVAVVWHYGFGTSMHYLHTDEVSNQRDAIAWIKKELPEHAHIIVDNVMLVELRDGTYINAKEFENAEWFYKVSNDPAVRIKKYNNNWKSFEYIAVTHEMLKQIQRFEDDNILRLAFDNSLPEHKWIKGSSSFIDEQKLITTNGDWAMLYSVNGNTKAQLVDSWKQYRDTYIHSYGQVIDPDTGLTTSQGQAYAMLRAVWMNDKITFDGVWAWTQHHLQHRLDDKLISSVWEDDRLVDATNASDADTDIALALLFAHKVWQEDSYKADAHVLMDDIWRQNVVAINGTYYVLAANESSAQRIGGYLFNPSYLSPAHFRVFGDVDYAHDWNKLADDSYSVLAKVEQASSVGLPANWYLLDSKTGEFQSAAPFVGGSADLYGYEAFRVMWRVSLDETWHDAPAATAYLDKNVRYLRNHIDEQGNLPSEIHTVNGMVFGRSPALAVATGHLLLLEREETGTAAAELYNTTFEAAYDEESRVWGSGDNYYNQNWVWLGVGLFNKNLPNLWAVL